MKIVIIGSGLAGCIAAGALSSHRPKVFEAKTAAESGLNSHYALMRMRDESVAKYLGCFAIKVRVLKEICNEHGENSQACSIQALNAYSKKVYGRLGNRSIEHLGYVDRYLIDAGNISSGDVKFGHKAYFIEGHKVGLSVIGLNDIITEDFDFCISTLPLPVNLELARMDVPDIFESKEIHIARGRLGIESDVHQTIYFPDFRFPVYRATLEGQEIIIESVEEISSGDIDHVLAAFNLALGYVDYKSMTYHSQKYGKIHCKDDDLRKALIYELTEKFGIYSLGRYAIWKPIRADHLAQDIERIISLFNTNRKSRDYENRRRQG